MQSDLFKKKSDGIMFCAFCLRTLIFTFCMFPIEFRFMLFNLTFSGHEDITKDYESMCRAYSFESFHVSFRFLVILELLYVYETVTRLVQIVNS